MPMSGTFSLSPLERRGLITWYSANKRDLPWRRASNPYAIWVSEIMLQQTRASTVVPYFERWMQRFPTVDSLASADPDEAFALWQGLGYYRRCRLLLKGAQWVKEHGMPRTEEAWKNVPGVGRYTAAAISSIAFNSPSAVVDGNVARVYARHNVCWEIGESLIAAARKWADASLDREHPGEWNQALMELGATLCKPRAPDCTHCPLRTGCNAHRRKIAHLLPKPRPAPETVRIEHLVWAPFHEGAFGFRKIPNKQWWSGLWEFPRTALNDETGNAPIGENQRLRKLGGQGWLEHLGTVRHHVTHHRITIQCWILRAKKRSKKLRWVEAADLDRVPLPSPQRRVANLALRQLGRL